MERKGEKDGEERRERWRGKKRKMEKKGGKRGYVRGKKGRCKEKEGMAKQRNRGGKGKKEGERKICCVFICVFLLFVIILQSHRRSVAVKMQSYY